MRKLKDKMMQKKMVATGLILLAGIMLAEGGAGQKTKVILFAGQSNCRGKGDFSKLTEEERVQLEQAQKQITLALFENKEKTVEPLHPFKASVHDREKYGPEWFFGPELFMGVKLNQQWPNQKFLFIKHAVGGSSLHGAWNIDWSADIVKGTPDEKRPRLYYVWSEYVQSVLATLNQDKYELAGMVWVQGESDNPGLKDGPKAEYSNHYKSNLLKLIKQARADMNAPNLPFFCLQIGQLPMWEVAEELKEVYVLRHDGKTGEGKYIYPMYPQSHYNYVGMKKIGANFGELYIEKCATAQ